MTEADVRELLGAWEAALGRELARLLESGSPACPAPVPESAGGGPLPEGTEMARVAPARVGACASPIPAPQAGVNLRIVRAEPLCHGGASAAAVEWVIDVCGHGPEAERRAWQLALALDDFAPGLRKGAVIRTRFHGIVERGGGAHGRACLRRLLFSTLLVAD